MFNLTEHGRITLVFGINALVSSPCGQNNGFLNFYNFFKIFYVLVPKSLLFFALSSNITFSARTLRISVAYICLLSWILYPNG